ncbi:LAMI_0H08680g1_1 [Lachancea mirantina]|uniref:LAMI_0H08680g1_1 n=1 Tax=Lachancea mirantina TaxID=1230905 RepID=A0A1G4KGG5_9SACH|nr:LAMI_0H08680g1_1 [Lachancea mirantina]
MDAATELHNTVHVVMSDRSGADSTAGGGSDTCVAAINRLERFLGSVDNRLERLEALLPGGRVSEQSGGTDTTTFGAATAAATAAARPRLDRIKNRGKKFVKWGRAQVSVSPSGALRKMKAPFAYAGLVSSPTGSSQLQAFPAAEQTAAIESEVDPSVLHLYHFLKNTTQEFRSRESTPFDSALDAVTLVSDSSPDLGVHSIHKFNRIWDEHFNAETASTPTLVSSPPSTNSIHSSATLQSVETTRTQDTSKTTQLLHNLDFLDHRLDVLIEDPAQIAHTINFFNWSTALEFGKTRHLHYYELPFPWRENRFIIHGYRFHHSYLKSFLSIFNWYGWHNETINIWTHLAGAMYFLYLMVYGFPQTAVYQSPQVPFAAKCIAYFFLAAGLECFLFSVNWHTFNGICHLVDRSRCACADYTGITILITASILTTEFAVLSGDSSSPYTLPLLCYTTASFIFGAFGVFMNWAPAFDRPEARPLRIAFYLLLASMGLLSYIHSTVLGENVASSTLIKPVLVKSLVWYVVGVIFYGTFIPERWRTDVLVDARIPTNEELSTNLDIITKHKHIHFRPKPTQHPNCCKPTNETETREKRKSLSSLWWVDYFCSHTLWHLFVMCGVTGHYQAMLEMFERRWLA